MSSSVSNKTEASAKSRGQRRLVLSEEEYTSTLSSIVQRDYFPQINELERQNALLECRSRGDVAGAVAVRRVTRRLMEHEEAIEAKRQDDDRDVMKLENGDSTLIRKRSRPLTEESLTGFHARVTNEDDQEFDVNLKQEIQSNRQRLERAFQLTNSCSEAADTPKRLHDGKFLLDEMASDDFAPESNRIAASEWNKPAMKNELFFNPTPLRGASIQAAAAAAKSADQKLLTNGNAANDTVSESDLQDTSNHPLMLPPTRSQTQNMMAVRSNSDASEPNATTTTIAAKSQLVEYIPKHYLEKKIDPSQTRFQTNNSIIPVAGQAIARRRTSTGLLDASDTDDTDSYATDTSLYSTDLDAPLRSVEQERKRREKRLRKEQSNQSYVAMTPQIFPGVAGNASPITTWGTIDQTPIVLSGRDPAEMNTMNESASTNNDGSSSFLLQAQSHREEVARRAERELARRAQRAKQPGAAAFTKKKPSDSRKTSSLTPSAMSLLKKTGRLSSRSRDAFGSALRSSYSQARSRSILSSRLGGGGSQSSRQKDHAYNATPQL
jgi:protein DGCR14